MSRLKSSIIQFQQGFLLLFSYALFSFGWDGCPVCWLGCALLVVGELWAEDLGGWAVSVMDERFMRWRLLS